MKFPVNVTRYVVLVQGLVLILDLAPQACPRVFGRQDHQSWHELNTPRPPSFSKLIVARPYRFTYRPRALECVI